MTPILRILARGVAAGALCVGGGLVAAQPVSSLSRPTLAQAVEAAWQRAAEAAQADGRARRARADSVAAEAPWAAPPAVELAHRSDRPLTDVGARETDVGVVMPLWLPGQRGARLESARAADEAADASRDAARLRIAGQVREAVWDVLLQRAELVLAQARNETLAALAADVERRVAAGDLARADALAARAEALASAAELMQARARLQASSTRWQALTGLADVPEPERPGDDAIVPSPQAGHALLRAARSEVELARKRLDAALRSRRSPPELFARLRSGVPSRSEPSQNSVTLGLRVPLATEDRNAPLLAAATADLNIALATERRLQRQLEAEVESGRAEADAAERQVAEHLERVRLLRERSALLERSFRAGETALPEMLRVLASAAQAEAALERQRAAAGLARARLQQALGIHP